MYYFGPDSGVRNNRALELLWGIILPALVVWKFFFYFLFVISKSWQWITTLIRFWAGCCFSRGFSLSRKLIKRIDRTNQDALFQQMRFKHWSHPFTSFPWIPQKKVEFLENTNHCSVSKVKCNSLVVDKRRQIPLNLLQIFNSNNFSPFNGNLGFIVEYCK